MDGANAVCCIPNSEGIQGKREGPGNTALVGAASKEGINTGTNEE